MEGYTPTFGYWGNAQPKPESAAQLIPSSTAHFVDISRHAETPAVMPTIPPRHQEDAAAAINSRIEDHAGIPAAVSSAANISASQATLAASSVRSATAKLRSDDVPLSQACKPDAPNDKIARTSATKLPTAAAGRAKFGIGKLRLKGTKEVQQAAEQLHAWEAELAAQQESLRQYQGIVLQREQALYLAEAKAAADTQALAKQSTEIEAAQKRWEGLRAEADSLANYYRHNAASVRTREIELNAKADRLAERVKAATALEQEVQDRKEIAEQMVQAVRRREARCLGVEADLAKREAAVESTRAALASYQTDVEQFVQAQVKRQALDRDPTGAAAAQLVEAEEQVKQRQAALLPRLKSVQQAEDELRRRGERIEIRRHEIMQLESRIKIEEQETIQAATVSTAQRTGGGLDSAATATTVRAALDEPGPRVKAELERRRQHMMLTQREKELAEQGIAMVRRQAELQKHEDRVAELEHQLAANIEEQEMQQRRALAAAKAASERLAAELESREAAAEQREIELKEAKDQHRQAEAEWERYERVLISREARCTRAERDIKLRERELQELAENCRVEVEQLERGRRDADSEDLALRRRQLEILAKVEDLGQWEKELMGRDWSAELKTPLPLHTRRRMDKADEKGSGNSGD